MSQLHPAGDSPTPDDMRIEHVSHHVAEMVLSASRELGFDLGAFMRETGMPHPETGPVTWDELTLFIDAVVDFAGYEALEEVVGDLDRLVPTSMPLFAAFVSPERLYAFINGVMAQTMYPMLISEHSVDDEGVIELVSTLREGFRPCENFFRVIQASQAAIPCFIGLRPSTVYANWHPRGGRYRIYPPASRTLVSRARRSLEDTWAEALTEEFRREKRRLAKAYERLWMSTREIEEKERALERALEEKADLSRKLSESESRERDVEARARQLAAELELTERQREVLARLLGGASNKDIAEALGCSPRTVEVHVGKILKLSGQASRAALIARAFAELDGAAG